MTDENDLEMLSANEAAKTLLGHDSSRSFHTPCKLFAGRKPQYRYLNNSTVYLQTISLEDGIAQRDEVDFWIERYRETKASPSKCLNFGTPTPKRSSYHLFFLYGLVVSSFSSFLFFFFFR